MRAFTAMVMAFLATVALAGSAFALEATGADNYEVGDKAYNVLQVDGEQGDVVFLTVKQGDRVLARDYACTLDAANANADGTAFFVTMDPSSFDGLELDGSCTIEAYSSRSEDDQLYAGSVYGVYADLPDGSSKLIGVRVIGSADASRAFNAPESLYVDGRTFKLSGVVEGSDVLHFAYEEYDEATTVDGVIKYIDTTGTVVATTKIPGIGFGVDHDPVPVPSAITGDNGDIYRTVSSFNEVLPQNPGQTAFTIQCVKMSDADKAAANFYVATIQLVDGDGKVIASDSVNVTGEFLYTAPTAIYKTITNEKGEPQAITYNISGSPLIHLSAANDGVTNRSRVISVRYEAEEVDASQAKVTFNLLDGSKRVNDKGRVLGTETVTKEGSSAQPSKEQIEVDGVAYHLVGNLDDYTYEYGSHRNPVVDVYYTPEGYSAPGPYEVTVNYVNFITGETVGSKTVQSSPDDLGAISIDTPESFSADGVDYVRLAGQDSAIEHSYYSGIAAYIVYYRDVNDTLTSGTVINTIRVVYADGGTGTAGSANAGADAETAAATATTRAAAEAADAQELQLNAGRTYNVLDGDGNNSTLTNEEGVDSNTERIDDEANPLASGVEGDGQNAVVQGVPAWALPVGAVVAALAVLMFALWAVRRRKADDNGENA